MAKIVFESEKELEDYICENLDQEYNPINGDHVNWYGRQIDLGAYGILDVMTVSFEPEGYLDISIIELKKELVTIKAIAQVSRYIRGIRHYFESHADDVSISVHGYVVAPNLDLSDDTVFLLNQLSEDISIYTMNFDLDKGTEFISCDTGWSKTNPDFTKFHSIHGIPLVADSKQRGEEYAKYMSQFEPIEIHQDDNKENPQEN
jgi:hypothetical protein